MSIGNISDTGEYYMAQLGITRDDVRKAVCILGSYRPTEGLYKKMPYHVCLYRRVGGLYMEMRIKN